MLQFKTDKLKANHAILGYLSKIDSDVFKRGEWWNIID